MKEYDIVELIKMRPKYEKEGLKLGDFGAVMCEKPIDGEWYVIFSEFYTGKDIADLCVKEEDLKVWDKFPEEKLPPRKNNIKQKQ